MSNGKGDSPRNCFSKRFKDNYTEIDWAQPKDFEICDNCGAKIFDYDSDSRQLKNQNGLTYVCSKEGCNGND